MALTIELPPDIEERLNAVAEARGLHPAAYVTELIRSSLPLSVPPREHPPEDFEAWLEKFAQYSDQIPPMPGETFSREMIYQDHD